MIAQLSAVGLLVAHPIAAATRSPEALPLLAGASTTPYVNGIEQRWRCVEVENQSLSLDHEFVQVDPEGSIVVDDKGDPIRCRPSVQAADARGFPIEILLGTVGLAGLIAAASGGGTTTNGGNDSPG